MSALRQDATAHMSGVTDDNPFHEMAGQRQVVLMSRFLGAGPGSRLLQVPVLLI